MTKYRIKYSILHDVRKLMVDDNQLNNSCQILPFSENLFERFDLDSLSIMHLLLNVESSIFHINLDEINDSTAPLFPEYRSYIFNFTTEELIQFKTMDDLVALFILKFNNQEN